jgi:hypothetical protein
MFHKRVVQNPLMQAFDAPDATVSCGRRTCTTVAPQALALLNDPFLRACASDFARRLIAESGSQREQQVKPGFQRAISRPPTGVELEASLQFLESQAQARRARDPAAPADAIDLLALTDLCQTLFSLNEFVYVD